MSNQVELQLRLVEDVVHQLKKLAEPPLEEVVTKALPIIVVMSTIILQKVASFRLWQAQEKNLLIALLDHLKKQDQLAVVAFTFSRNRCDHNSSLLTSVDLVTAEERGRIHQFFQKCVSRLKGSNQKLSQVCDILITANILEIILRFSSR
jgi:hypothetical protein